MHGRVRPPATSSLVSGPATLVNSKIANLTSVWDKINDAINPFRTRDPSTELVCAVVRLPLANGIAKVDRSLADGNRKSSACRRRARSTSATRRSTSRSSPRRARACRSISPGSRSRAHHRAVYARLTSRWTSRDRPRSSRSIGAAVGTGGLSAVGQALFTWAEGKGPGPAR